MLSCSIAALNPVTAESNLNQFQRNPSQVGLSRSELNVKCPVKPCFKITVNFPDHGFKKLMNKQST